MIQTTLWDTAMPLALPGKAFAEINMADVSEQERWTDGPLTCLLPI